MSRSVYAFDRNRVLKKMGQTDTMISLPSISGWKYVYAWVCLPYCTFVYRFLTSQVSCLLNSVWTHWRCSKWYDLYDLPNSGCDRKFIRFICIYLLLLRILFRKPGYIPSWNDMMRTCRRFICHVHVHPSSKLLSIFAYILSRWCIWMERVGTHFDCIHKGSDIEKNNDTKHEVYMCFF